MTCNNHHNNRGFNKTKYGYAKDLIALNKIKYNETVLYLRYRSSNSLPRINRQTSISCISIFMILIRFETFTILYNIIIAYTGWARIN